MLQQAILAVRGSDGVFMVNGPPSCDENADFKRDSSKMCKVMVFSPDASLFAWCNGETVSVVSVLDFKPVQTLPLPRVTGLHFSSKGTHLATWCPYFTTKDKPQGEPNLHLWNLQTGQCVKSFFQKKQQGWHPCWTEDEHIVTRQVSNELNFYEDNSFEKIAHRLIQQKVADYKLSPGASPIKVAIYVQGTQGAPSFVRLFKYPNFGGPDTAIANKSFFKGDHATLMWNKNATAVLSLATTDVDKTGASYYGEQGLHYLATNGDSAIVQLSKNGPIYDAAWSPNSTEFCVVYGFMPAKATLFNLRCDPIFDFGTGPRNVVAYSPSGRLLALAGFGNLRGKMEFWDSQRRELVGRVEAPDSTTFSWCPDGLHIVTATCSPRLRVGNGYKLWRCDNPVPPSSEVSCDIPELWEVLWRPIDLPEPELQMVTSGKAPASGNHKKTANAPQAPQAYRPPAMRNKPDTVKGLQDEELYKPARRSIPGLPADVGKEATRSKARSRGAKKAAKEAKAVEQIKNSDIVVDESLKSKPESRAKGEAVSNPDTTQTNDLALTTEKRLKGLNKKLRAIKKLKEDQASGKQMQKGQLVKIESEGDLLKEIAELAPKTNSQL
uniref:eukaryotic translation initiation factor 2A n=1 Tax=Myxine glutinosa TaxID=7769 RepID=UPI00358E4400